MKRKMYLFVALVAMMMASCSTMTRCEKLAHQGWEAKKIRGYGMGESANRNLARNIASLYARNEIASMMNAFIRSYTQEYEEEFRSSGGLGNSQMAVSIHEMAVDEEVRGAAIIYSDVYQKKNGYYVYEVCMELNQKSLEKALKKAGVKNVDTNYMQNTLNRIGQEQSKNKKKRKK